MPVNKQRRVFLICIILVWTYYFLFPRDSGKELVIQPLLHMTYNAFEERDETGVIGLNFGKRALYLDDNSMPLVLWEGTQMAVTDTWWAVSDGRTIEIREPDGRLRSKMLSTAIPFTVGESLFLYDRGPKSLSKIDPQSNQIFWTRQFFSTISALDVSDQMTLIGLLDGRCLLIEDSGEILLEYQPGGSMIEAIYGAAISENGNKIALIAGANPQRFILLEERKDMFRPVFHQLTETDFRNHVPIGFIRNDSMVFYEAETSMNIVDLEQLTAEKLELDAKSMSWSEVNKFDTLVLLGSKNSQSSIQILTRENRLIFHADFPQKLRYLRIAESSIFLVANDGYSILEMVVR